MDIITLIASALAPLGLDLGKRVLDRFLPMADVKPANFGELIQLKQADLELFKAMNDTSGGGDSYPWVNAVWRLMRPVVGVGVMGAWGYMHATGKGNLQGVDQMAGAVGFYLFGDRTLFYLKQGNNK